MITTNKKKISKKRTAPQSQPAIAAVAEPAPREVKTDRGQIGVSPIECNIIVKVSVLIWKSDTLGLIPVETIDKP